MSFGYDPNSKLSPEAQGIRDALMLQLIQGGKGGGSSSGCLIPFLVMVGTAGGILSGLLYGVVKIVYCLIV